MSFWNAYLRLESHSLADNSLDIATTKPYEIIEATPQGKLFHRSYSSRIEERPADPKTEKSLSQKEMADPLIIGSW